MVDVKGYDADVKGYSVDVIWARYYTKMWVSAEEKKKRASSKKSRMTSTLESVDEDEEDERPAKGAAGPVTESAEDIVNDEIAKMDEDQKVRYSDDQLINS
eukprot:4367527-Pyramimonas_sp.AAC.2